jgi:cytidylate kinase
MAENKKIIIAIDGYSSCGKSTFARMLAEYLKYTYLDTGAMYRAVTLCAIQNNCISNSDIDEKGLDKLLETIKIEFRRNEQKNVNETYLNGQNVEEQIRTLEVSSKVSVISSYKIVRERMVFLQREMSKQGGVVLDGRDIGTVVFPHAELKIFMTADPDIRAMRRYKELTDKGQQVDLSEIKANLEERDRIDTTRKESPLRQAEDALVLDNSYMTPQDQLVWVENKIAEILFN